MPRKPCSTSPGGTQGTVQARGKSQAVSCRTRWRRRSPRGSVKLEGKNDVAAVADLADEASLGAQVAAVDVMGSKLEQRLQEGLKDAVGYLRGRDTSGRRGAHLPLGLHRAKSTLHPFFELPCEDKAVLQNQPKAHMPASQQDPESRQQHPRPGRMGLLALESTRNPDHLHHYLPEIQVCMETH